MRYILGGLLLPRHTRAIEKPDAQVGKVVTLGGTLGVDVQNHRRSWEIEFPVITKEEWTNINAIYKSQFAGSGPMITFEGQAEAANDEVIPETTVWITASSRELKWAGSHADGYSLILEEENADS